MPAPEVRGRSSPPAPDAGVRLAGEGRKLHAQTPAGLEEPATADAPVEVEELSARAPVRPDSPTFRELGARDETVAALDKVGITHAFAIQEDAIPIALRGADIIGQAPTGTGKTLGFGVPILQRVLGPTEGAGG
jgi:ATP-dependent helicase YprA (DUF1998 family)